MFSALNSTEADTGSKLTRCLHKSAGYLELTGKIAVLGTCLFIPLSTSLMDGCALLALLAWILSGKVLLLPEVLRRHPAALFSLALFLVLLIGTAYSSASLQYSFSILAKYRKLLYLPMVICLIGNDHRMRRRALDCFIAGSILLMLVSYAMFFSVLPSMKVGYSLLFHITHSFFMALLAYCAGLRAMHQRHRYLWIAVLLFAAANIFYINPGRTGMISFVLLMIVLIIQNCSFKTILAGIVFITLALGAVYWSSPNFSSRTERVIWEITNYASGKSRTSTGQRFDWWKNSLALIQKSPVFGHGTGSFATEQNRLIENQNTKPTDNPHNEFLFITEQVGIIGLIAFLGIFASHILYARSLKIEDRFLLQAVMLAMASGCLFNSFLFDSHQGHFFAIVSGLFYSLPFPQSRNQADSESISV